jgi:predicted ATPase/DNA-binding winged helix-turn-helix (wHTH) protein
MQGYRFGRFEVRLIERRLLADGRSATIGARAFDVLRLLIENRDRLVTKRELLDGVWADLVVEENNLQTQVSTLRKWLGADTIATIPGQGYRFTMPVEVVGAAAEQALPPLPSLILGRGADVAAVQHTLHRHRLVTLLGAGGIGKTVVALAVAHAVRDGAGLLVAWVDLAPVRDAQEVASAVAQALALPSPSSAADAAGIIAAALAGRSLLLVLDNAEHQIGAVARLAAALLSGAPDVRMLLTSQAPLKIDDEHLIRLSALDVPPSDDLDRDEAMKYSALALFAALAQAADRHFVLDATALPVAIDICRQLDGVALAIKLAAARLPLLGLQGLRSRLSDRLSMLGGAARDAPARQHTLRAALDWSHGLLSPADQAVLRRLSVLPGPFSLDLAIAVAANAALRDTEVIDSLASLVDRSFVSAHGDGPQRFRLPAAVRPWAAMHLHDAGENDAVHGRLASALAQTMDNGYEAYWRSADAPWLQAHAPLLDPLRTALDWSTAAHPAIAADLIAHSGFVFLLLGLAAEGRRRWQAVCERIDAAGDAAILVPARFWLEGSRLYWGVSRERMHALAARAEQALRADARPRDVYLALRCLAACTHSEAAAEHVAEMGRIEQSDWPPRLRAQRLLAQFDSLKAADRTDALQPVLQSLLVLGETAGLDTVRGVALAGLADWHLAMGDAPAALRTARPVLDGPRHVYANHVLQALAISAAAHLRLDAPDEARAALAEFAALSRARGWEWFGLCADTLAHFAAQQGRFEAAARLVGYADHTHRCRGGRDANAARERERAASLLDGRLTPGAADRLFADGALLDEAAAVALAVVP